MSAAYDIEAGYQQRRDFARSQWEKYSQLAQQWHDEFFKAEREVCRMELRRLPEPAPPVRMEIVEE